MVTAAVVQDGLDGLITVRIISKARPCAKLTGMIEADLAPISHVSGSHQLGRTLHEVIIFTIIMTRQRCGGAMCSACTEPVVRSVGCYCTRRTCCASGATHTYRYARRSSRSSARDATSCMAMDGLTRGLIEGLCGIALGRQSWARTDERPWLLRFVCDAWAKIQAIFQRFSAVLKHGSWLIMSVCTCRGQPRGLVQGRFVT